MKKFFLCVTLLVFGFLAQAQNATPGLCLPYEFLRDSTRLQVKPIEKFYPIEENRFEVPVHLLTLPLLGNTNSGNLKNGEPLIVNEIKLPATLEFSKNPVSEPAQQIDYSLLFNPNQFEAEPLVPIGD